MEANTRHDKLMRGGKVKFWAAFIVVAPLLLAAVVVYALIWLIHEALGCLEGRDDE